MSRMIDAIGLKQSISVSAILEDGKTLEQIIDEQPTIEERKKGKWVDSHTTCSECGWQMLDDVMETPNIVGFKFCPNCGAKMKEGE